MHPSKQPLPNLLKLKAKGSEQTCNETLPWSFFFQDFFLYSLTGNRTWNCWNLSMLVGHFTRAPKFHFTAGYTINSTAIQSACIQHTRVLSVSGLIPTIFFKMIYHRWNLIICTAILNPMLSTMKDCLIFCQGNNFLLKSFWQAVVKLP